MSPMRLYDDLSTMKAGDVDRVYSTSRLATRDVLAHRLPAYHTLDIAVVDETQCVSIRIEVALVVQLALSRPNPVHVPKQRVDLSVVPEHAHRLRQRPLGHGVRANLVHARRVSDPAEEPGIRTGYGRTTR